MKPWMRGIVACGVVAVAGCGELGPFDPIPTTLPPEKSRVEQFTQSAVPGRDILWIIDNTLSMTEEVGVLSPLFSTFIDGLYIYDTEIAYQVGITTTDLNKHGGRLQGIPWIITPETPGADQAFEANVVGVLPTGPGQSGPELGLDAMLAALSDGMLAAGAPNYGFLRPDEGLSIIVVSDSDDSAQTGLEQYIAFLIDLKGGATADRVIFSAIAGPPDTGCFGSEGRAALPAPRYFEMTEALNGEFASICSNDFDEVIASLGEHQAALKTRFPLADVPLEDSIVVHVDGERMEEGTAWSLDELLNAVVFAPGFVPPFGAVVRVSYQYDPTVTP